MIRRRLLEQVGGACNGEPPSISVAIKQQPEKAGSFTELERQLGWLCDGPCAYNQRAGWSMREVRDGQQALWVACPQLRRLRDFVLLYKVLLDADEARPALLLHNDGKHVLILVRF